MLNKFKFVKTNKQSQFNFFIVFPVSQKSKTHLNTNYFYHLNRLYIVYVLCNKDFEMYEISTNVTFF